MACYYWRQVISGRALGVALDETLSSSRTSKGKLATLKCI